MKMREEIDALRTMGFDPIEVPDPAAHAGAGDRAADPGVPSARLSGALWRRPRSRGSMAGSIRRRFLLRLRDAISIDHFTVGIIKAPVDGRGDRHTLPAWRGLAVQGSAESLGQHTHRLGGEGDLLCHRDGRRGFAIFFASIGIVTMAEADPRRHHPGVRDITVQFGFDPRARRGSTSTSSAARFLGLCWSLRRRQVGPDAHHHRPSCPRSPAPHRSVSVCRSRRRQFHVAPFGRTALGHPVPAGCAVLLAHRAPRTSSFRVREYLKVIAAPASMRSWWPSSAWSGCALKWPTGFPSRVGPAA